MPSSTLVISEIFGGGGNMSAPYLNDYIEIHNISGEPFDLSGYSVQYASSTGGSWQVTTLSGTIPAKGFFLVQEGAGAGNGSPLPNPDSTGNIAMSSSSGKVALVKGTIALMGQDPSSNQIVDIVSYGTANSTEGNPAPEASNTQSVMRNIRVDQDTDDNSVDFVTGAPDPQNSRSAPTCYTTGTLISTTRGDVAVEALAIGDRALTASGENRLVRWIGSRAVDCAGFADPRRARPIRIAAHAFGEGKPARDLRVSPDHAIAVSCLDEVLVPAFAFLNGATVTQDRDDSVTYWHVELEGGHDILVAEGLPAESYLDCGNRGFFAGEAVAMDPCLDAVGSCRERTTDPVLLTAVRARLRRQALALGWRLDAAELGGLRLIADGATILPDSDGLAARFLLPATAKDVWLVSAAGVPWDVGDAADGRRLGLCLASLAFGDGLSVQRDIALDDPRLADGFHPQETGASYRWTDGRARLDPDLWAGCRGHVMVRVALSRACIPAWRAPTQTCARLRVA